MCQLHRKLSFKLHILHKRHDIGKKEAHKLSVVFNGFKYFVKEMFLEYVTMPVCPIQPSH